MSFYCNKCKQATGVKPTDSGYKCLNCGSNCFIKPHDLGSTEIYMTCECGHEQGVYDYLKTTCAGCGASNRWCPEDSVIVPTGDFYMVVVCIESKNFDWDIEQRTISYYTCNDLDAEEIRVDLTKFNVAIEYLLKDFKEEINL